MNILILHQMGNPKRWLKSVADLELALVQNDSNNNYIVHNSIFKFPEFLKDYPFDGIILNSTFLDARHQRSRLDRIVNEYEFIKTSSAVKIALAQDDYDCHLELDCWMLDWDVDYFYSVVHEYSQELFPNYIAKKGPVLKGYTGYINANLIDLASHTNSYSNRQIDVGYRATDVVTNLNKLVILKAQIGKRFIEKFEQYGLRLDISSRNEDRIYGTNWFHFIQDCRFMIGTNSGSSLIIPDLEHKERIENYLLSNRNWEYAKVKETFFPFQNESISYTAISPRNIEAAILDTCQINTTLGNYSGILNPWEHFIPLDEHCSNHVEVFEAMKDSDYIKHTISNAKEAILSYNELRLDHLVSDLLSKIQSKYLSNKHSSSAEFSNLQSKYDNYIAPLQKVQWTIDIVKERIKKLINYKTKGTRVS